MLTMCSRLAMVRQLEHKMLTVKTEYKFVPSTSNVHKLVTALSHINVQAQMLIWSKWGIFGCLYTKGMCSNCRKVSETTRGTIEKEYSTRNPTSSPTAQHKVERQKIDQMSTTHPVEAWREFYCFRNSSKLTTVVDTSASQQQTVHVTMRSAFWIILSLSASESIYTVLLEYAPVSKEGCKSS